MQNIDVKSEPRFYPAQMGYLPPKFVEKAREELCETDQIKTSSLREMRDRIKSEPGLEPEWFSDNDLLMFLRPKKFNVQKSFDSLKKSIANIKKYADYFELSIDPGVVNTFIEKNIARVLPYRDKEGCAIFFQQLRAWDPNEFPITKAFTYINLALWNVMKDPMTQVCGAKLVYDFKSDMAKYIPQFSPFNLRMYYNICMDCVPVRRRGGHLLNANTITSIALPFFLAFLPEELRKRVFSHRNGEDILDHLDADIVPTEYGGRLNLDDYKSDLGSNIQWPNFVVKVLESVKKRE